MNKLNVAHRMQQPQRYFNKVVLCEFLYLGLKIDDHSRETLSTKTLRVTFDLSNNQLQIINIVLCSLCKDCRAWWHNQNRAT